MRRTTATNECILVSEKNSCRNAISNKLIATAYTVLTSVALTACDSAVISTAAESENLATVSIEQPQNPTSTNGTTAEPDNTQSGAPTTPDNPTPTTEPPMELENTVNPSPEQPDNTDSVIPTTPDNPTPTTEPPTEPENTVNPSPEQPDNTDSVIPATPDNPTPTTEPPMEPENTVNPSPEQPDNTDSVIPTTPDNPTPTTEPPTETENPVTPPTEEPGNPDGNTPAEPTNPPPVNSVPEGLPDLPSAGLSSFDTGHTISLVRHATSTNGQFIAASSYEGAVVAIDFNGTVLWEKELSGVTNHDLWVDDMDGDGNDEIYAANADGSLYALDYLGRNLWQRSLGETPLSAVTTVDKDNTTYLVAGGYDKNLYYLDLDGVVVMSIASSDYSDLRAFGSGRLPENNTHTINRLRPVTRADGSQSLAVIATNNQLQTAGYMYLFEPLENAPSHSFRTLMPRPIGHMTVADINADGSEEVLLGTTGSRQSSAIKSYDLLNDTEQQLAFPSLGNPDLGSFGYRTSHIEQITAQGVNQFLVLYGNQIVLTQTDLSDEQVEVLTSTYSYNDLFKIPGTNTLLMASAQSGGSAVHVLNTENPQWKEQYINLDPPGNIDRILNGIDRTRENLALFSKSPDQSQSRPVYLLSATLSSDADKAAADKVKTLYPDNPVFLGNKFSPFAENWDRGVLTSELYRDIRDPRRRYDYNQQQVLDLYAPLYAGDSAGAAFWGGHGTDPLYFSPDTYRRLFDQALGKKTVLIFPELEKHDEDFASVINEVFYPLAEHGKSTGGQLSIRTKNSFWFGAVHLPLWSRLVSGEFAGQFVPSMEETLDKLMDISVSGRIGLWASGSTDEWGTRFARDNAVYNGLDQKSHQVLPNAALRQLIYAVANGATQLNNYPVSQEYMSLLWELIGSGALYVPKREDLLHISPVHLSMVDPHERFIEQSVNRKWTTFYDQSEEQANPMVFGRLNGTWPGAPVTRWDFSRYASGAPDRRLNFLPPYANGLVLITPPQPNASTEPRGLLKDKLHPIYNNILKEYFTDGHSYFSEDKSEVYAADDYYQVIEKDIVESAKLLPATVTGDVAWTLAQTSPTNLRLTLIDSGYLNPGSKRARVTFNTIEPISITDILDGTTFKRNQQNAIGIDIGAGGFRFIDIELNKPL